MARTINEILDEMLLEKQTMATLNGLQPNIDNTQTLLADLTSASKVAVWRLMFFVMAVGIWMHEKRFDDHVVWINARALELIVGTPQWYFKKALEFQYGDALVLVNGQYQYAAVNEVAKIVKLVSVNEIGGQLFLKVAKLDVAGEPEPLTTLELDGFIAYMQKIKFAGVIITCVSRVPDLLRIQYRVYVDPLLINANGELISNTAIKPIEVAINNYCKGLPFNGVFSITELTDQIQNVAGVINPVYENASAQYGVNPFVSLGDYYNPNAGYLRVDPAFPLLTSITYILA
jgi:hypothetical protein